MFWGRTRRGPLSNAWQLFGDIKPLRLVRNAIHRQQKCPSFCNHLNMSGEKSGASFISEATETVRKGLVFLGILVPSKDSAFVNSLLLILFVQMRLTSVRSSSLNNHSKSDKSKPKAAVISEWKGKWNAVTVFFRAIVLGVYTSRDFQVLISDFCNPTLEEKYSKGLFWTKRIYNSKKLTSFFYKKQENKIII